MDRIFMRTKMLLGDDGFKKVQDSKVIIFGVGGVGSYVVEGLARSGVLNITLVDGDEVAYSNINRQIIATTKTVGMRKTDVARDRILDINPECKVTCIDKFFLPENAQEINLLEYDYVVDAIDTVSSKIYLAEFCYKNKIKIISSMGAGNKLDATKFQVADVYKTTVCPLARVMRRELKARRVSKLKVVYSTEPAIKPHAPSNSGDEVVKAGSIAFVPSVVGLIIAGEVIKDLAFSSK